MGGGGFSRASRLLPLQSLKKVPIRRALQDTWGCASHSSGGCSDGVREVNISTGAFVMVGVVIGAETSSSWVVVIIVNFFNCHEEWLWWWL